MDARGQCRDQPTCGLDFVDVRSLHSIEFAIPASSPRSTLIVGCARPLAGLAQDPVTWGWRALVCAGDNEDEGLDLAIVQLGHRQQRSFTTTQRMSQIDRGCVETRRNLQTIEQSKIFRDFFDSERPKASQKRTKQARVKRAEVFTQPCMGISVSSFIACDCAPMVEGCFD
jgi:hypothetical protein